MNTSTTRLEFDAHEIPELFAKQQQKYAKVIDLYVLFFYAKSTIPPTIRANGLLFDRTKQGIMPELLEELLILRKKTKRTMKELEQELYKRKHTQPHFAH